MTKQFAAAAFAAAAVLVSQSVFAQTSAAPQPAASGSMKSLMDGVTVSLAGGATFTQKAGGFVGGEITTKEYYKNTSFSFEAGWMSNVVSKGRLDSAQAIADYLAQTQGQPASATLKVPGGYFALNARYRLMTKPRYLVYALAGGGLGITSPKTTFILGGADVSGSLGQYGVTLGKDLSGGTASGLLNVGVGATMPHGKWVGDASYRFTPIFSPGGATLVNRLDLSVGYKF